MGAKKVQVLLLLGAFLCTVALRASVEAHAGNCTEEQRQEHLEKCATEHLKTLEANHFFDAQEGVEELYKDPRKFVSNKDLCNNSKESADYMECSIGVFELCSSNTSQEDSHTGPLDARKAVEQFCADLDEVLERVNRTSFEACIKEHEENVHSCVDKYVIEDGGATDVCNDHATYTACMAKMDECSGEKGVRLFTTWAEHMTPEKCNGASELVATMSVMLAAVGVSLLASSRMMVL